MSSAALALPSKTCAGCKERDAIIAENRGTYHKHLAELQAKYEGMPAECVQLRQTVAAKEAECAQLQKTVARLQAQLNESEKRVEKRVDQFAAAGNVLSQIWKKNQEYIEQARAAEKEAAEAKKEAEEARKEAAEARKEADEAKKEAEEAKNEAAEASLAAEAKKEMSTNRTPTMPTTDGEIGPNGAKIRELDVDDAQFYAVQRIMGMRHKDGWRDFLIKWIGYEELEWTPEDNCGACEFAIAKFKEDMGWRGLKPWTQSGKWLLPTDKWNFEEGEHIPDEHLAGGSGLAQAELPTLSMERATSSGLASDNSGGSEGSSRKRAATPQHTRKTHVKTESSQKAAQQKKRRLGVDVPAGEQLQ